jgi:type II secretory pathway component PulF
MPTYKFEAMDTSGGEVKDSVDALNEDEALLKIRQMGYFVTKITGPPEREMTLDEELEEMFVTKSREDETTHDDMTDDECAAQWLEAYKAKHSQRQDVP